MRIITGRKASSGLMLQEGRDIFFEVRHHISQLLIKEGKCERARY
jgi:hypothetical protein